jgi:hypothetical protein
MGDHIIVRLQKGSRCLEHFSQQCRTDNDSQEDDKNEGAHEDVRDLHSPDITVSILEPRSSKDTAIL